MANPAVLGSAAVVAERSFIGKIFAGCWFCLRRVPLFLYTLGIYAFIEYNVPDVRRIIVDIGTFKLTWVEVIHVMASIAAMWELLRVSKPGVDNTFEALLMSAMFIIYLVLFIISTMGEATWLRIFNNTEFVALLLISGAQVVLAFLINARTLKRTIDYTDH